MKDNPGIYLLAAALAAACCSASAAPRPADGRLAYLQYVDKGCVAGVWDSKSRTSRIVVTLPECPAAVSVTSHERVLVLIFPTSIRLVDLSGGKIQNPIPMPADAVTKNRSDEASLAGYTSDGRLALRLFGLGPADRNISQVFLYKDHSWTKVDEKVCGGYSDECPAQLPIEARQLDDAYGIGPDGLFNESLTADPYVVHRTSQDPQLPPGSEDQPLTDEEDMSPTHVTLSFHVYDKDTQLLFDTVPGQDTAGTYTFGLKLVLPDAPVLTITTDQFGSTLMGHYLFYHGFFGNGVRLYDVGNGEVVLDKLETGGWLEAPAAGAPQP